MTGQDKADEPLTGQDKADEPAQLDLRSLQIQLYLFSGAFFMVLIS